MKQSGPPLPDPLLPGEYLFRVVAQTFQSAVSPTFLLAVGTDWSIRRGAFERFAGWKACDTADTKVCATLIRSGREEREPICLVSSGSCLDSMPGARRLRRFT